MDGIYRWTIYIYTIHVHSDILHLEYNLDIMHIDRVGTYLMIIQDIVIEHGPFKDDSPINIHKPLLSSIAVLNRRRVPPFLWDTKPY